MIKTDKARDRQIHTHPYGVKAKRRKAREKDSQFDWSTVPVRQVEAKHVDAAAIRYIHTIVYFGWV